MIIFNKLNVICMYRLQIRLLRLSKATPKYYNEFIYLYSSIYLVMHKKHPRNLPEKQKCDL